MPEKQSQIGAGHTLTRVRLLRMAFLAVSLISTMRGQSQCTISAPAPIPDDGVLTIQFNVSGLLDGNLSSPTQGICGVLIDFMHEYLGDLTVTLISPSGTQVVLIGPPTTAISPTNLSRWNIGFVPCGTAASPDAGFTDMWSNLQTWQALTPYSGIYHPQSGCLEDFNTGSANGIWQIIIEDHDQFQNGSLSNLTLIFCNPAGLTCSECTPNAGILSPASLTICSGENIQSNAISIDFGGNTPLPAVYGYQFLMTSGNSIIQSGSAFSISPPAGSFSICGLSYALSDETDIENLISAGDFDVLVQAVDAGIVCAEVTTSCFVLNVLDKPDTIVVSTNLCNGEVFTYQGQNYTTDGVFYQMVDGPGLCDTIHEIRIAGRPLSVITNVPDTISCGSGPVSLTASAAGSAGPFTFLWTTQNGNIVSSPALPSVNVDQPGQYVVTVTDGVCDGSGGVTVQADQGFPQIFVTGGTLTCSQPSLTLTPIYIPTDGSIQWTGPGGFTAVTPSITTSIGGVYSLTITNQAGCATTRTIDVLTDTMTYPVAIILLAKNCQNMTQELANADDFGVVGWNYSGPNGFFTDYWRPPVSDPGLYTLTATFANGCTRSSSYFFDGDFTIPDVMVSPDDTLNCNEAINLSISSSFPNTSFSWTGPQGYSSGMSTIQIAEPGQYIGRVSAINGCAASDTVLIEQGPDIFNYQILTDTLSCAKDSVFIGVNAPLAEVFEWSNYNGPDSTEAFILVGSPGTFTVTMIDTHSGCEVVTSIFVPGDFAPPYYAFVQDTVSCIEPLAELQFLPRPGQTYLLVEWQLPDLTTSNSPTIMADLPGSYVLTVVNQNGCIGQTGFQLPFDTLRPLLLIESDTIGCADTVQLGFQSPDVIASFQWTGPGIISQTGMAVAINQPGWYHLEVVGVNGCISSGDVLVDSNYVLPSYSIDADSLRCDNAATLAVVASEPGQTYAWYDPSGQLITMDSFIQVIVPGVYLVDITGVNQCTVSDTVTLDSLMYPGLILMSDSFTCVHSDANITATIGIPQFTFEWTDLSGSVLGTTTSLLMTTANPGPVVAIVTGPNACVTMDTIVVPFDTIPPTAMILQVGEVRCQEKDFMLDGGGSFPQPLSYNWTTQSGLIISDPSMPLVQASDSGTYMLVVQSMDNGCVDSSIWMVMYNSDAIERVNLDLTPAQCSGDGNASINVLNIDGGIGPFLYQLGTTPPQSDPFFDGLDPGSFLLTVIDSEGCEYDTIFTIQPTGTFIVDAGDDIDIHLGETTMLMGMTDLPVDQLVNEAWDMLSGNLCNGCHSVDVSPLETTSYIYEVTTATGCIKSDTVIVYVFEKGKFFIPNVFTPNGDGNNEEIRFFASPGIEKVLKWIIFDRWGNAVFGRENFDPGDPTVYWDGRTSTDDFPSSAVFAYILEIQLINGKIESWHGDITLLR